MVPVSLIHPSSGGIQFYNSFGALRRNDENDAPIDGGHEVFFGDESDKESFPGSVHGGGEVVEEAIPMEARPRVVNLGLGVLGGVDLSEEFHQRPHTMRSVPFTMRGAYKGVMQVVLDVITEGRHRRNALQEERGWKLFFFIPSCCSSDKREEASSPETSWKTD